MIDDLGIERCVHVTESAGCAVALTAAARRPDTFAALVLCAPAHWLLDPLDDPPVVSGQPRPSPEDIEERLAGAVVESMADTDDPVIRRWARDLLGDDWEALMAWNQLSVSADLRDTVPAVEVPTLVIHGGADPVSDVGGAERLAERLPRGEIEVITGAAHAPMVTRPDDVRAAIESFLDDLGS